MNLGKHDFEIMLGITPLSIGVNIQSSSMVFPLAIFKAKEDRDVLKQILQPLFDELEAISAHPISFSVSTTDVHQQSVSFQVHSPNEQPTDRSFKTHQFHWVMVADLKISWQLFNVPKGGCMFCNCTSVDDRVEKCNTSHTSTFSRQYTAEDILFPNISITGMKLCNMCHL